MYSSLLDREKRPLDLRGPAYCVLKNIFVCCCCCCTRKLFSELRGGPGIRLGTFPLHRHVPLLGTGPVAGASYTRVTPRADIGQQNHKFERNRFCRINKEGGRLLAASFPCANAGCPVTGRDKVNQRCAGCSAVWYCGRRSRVLRLTSKIQNRA